MSILLHFDVDVSHELRDLGLVADVRFLQKNLRRRETIAELLLQDRHFRIDDIRHRSFRAGNQKILDHGAAKCSSSAGDYRDSIFKDLHIDAP